MLGMGKGGWAAPWSTAGLLPFPASHALTLSPLRGICPRIHPLMLSLGSCLLGLPAFLALLAFISSPLSPSLASISSLFLSFILLSSLLPSFFFSTLPLFFPPFFKFQLVYAVQTWGLFSNALLNTKRLEPFSLPTVQMTNGHTQRWEHAQGCSPQ